MDSKRLNHFLSNILRKDEQRIAIQKCDTLEDIEFDINTNQRRSTLDNLYKKKLTQPKDFTKFAKYIPEPTLAQKLSLPEPSDFKDKALMKLKVSNQNLTQPAYYKQLENKKIFESENSGYKKICRKSYTPQSETNRLSTTRKPSYRKTGMVRERVSLGDSDNKQNILGRRCSINRLSSKDNSIDSYDIQIDSYDQQEKLQKTKLIMPNLPKDKLNYGFTGLKLNRNRFDSPVPKADEPHSNVQNGKNLAPKENTERPSVLTGELLVRKRLIEDTSKSKEKESVSFVRMSNITTFDKRKSPKEGFQVSKTPLRTNVIDLQRCEDNFNDFQTQPRRKMLMDDTSIKLRLNQKLETPLSRNTKKAFDRNIILDNIHINKTQIAFKQSLDKNIGLDNNIDMVKSILPPRIYRTSIDHSIDKNFPEKTIRGIPRLARHKSKATRKGSKANQLSKTLEEPKNIGCQKHIDRISTKQKSKDVDGENREQDIQNLKKYRSLLHDFDNLDQYKYYDFIPSKRKQIQYEILKTETKIKQENKLQEVNIENIRGMQRRNKFQCLEDFEAKKTNLKVITKLYKKFFDETRNPKTEIVIKSGIIPDFIFTRDDFKNFYEYHYSNNADKIINYFIKKYDKWDESDNAVVGAWLSRFETFQHMKLKFLKHLIKYFQYKQLDDCAVFKKDEPNDYVLILLKGSISISSCNKRTQINAIHIFNPNLLKEKSESKWDIGGTVYGNGHQQYLYLEDFEKSKLDFKDKKNPGFDNKGIGSHKGIGSQSELVSPCLQDRNVNRTDTDIKQDNKIYNFNFSETIHQAFLGKSKENTLTSKKFRSFSNQGSRKSKRNVTSSIFHRDSVDDCQESVTKVPDKDQVRGNKLQYNMVKRLSSLNKNGGIDRNSLLINNPLNPLSYQVNKTVSFPQQSNTDSVKQNSTRSNTFEEPKTFMHELINRNVNPNQTMLGTSFEKMDEREEGKSTGSIKSPTLKNRFEAHNIMIDNQPRQSIEQISPVKIPVRQSVPKVDLLNRDKSVTFEYSDMSPVQSINKSYNKIYVNNNGLSISTENSQNNHSESMYNKNIICEDKQVDTSTYSQHPRRLDTEQYNNFGKTHKKVGKSKVTTVMMNFDMSSLK